MIVIEDGSGLPNSQSYVSVAQLRAYWVARGSAVITAAVPADAVLEQSLVKATQYIDYHFRERFKGRKNTYAQALAWPRWGVLVDGSPDDYWVRGLGTVSTGFNVPTNVIPPMLMDALCESAMIDVQSPGSLAPDIAAGAGSVISKKVGPIEVHYTPGALPYPIFRMVNLLLAPLLRIKGGTKQIVRS